MAAREVQKSHLAFENTIKQGAETRIGATEQNELDRNYARMMMIYDLTGDKTQRDMLRLIEVNIYEAQDVGHDPDATLAGADEVRAEWAEWNERWEASHS